MGSEIDVESANYVLTNLFGDHLDSTERRGYREIVAFLSDEVAFTSALDRVSHDLWRAYNISSIQNLDGRFTAALREAAHCAGFSYPDFAVFTGPLDSQVFLDHIRKGYFWKDSFAPEHGEFSHAFQWLAIQRHFGSRINVPRLYRRTPDIKAVVPIVNASALVNGISLWPWLCDCFPYSRYDQKFGAHDNFTHTYSDTFRTPNTVEAYARGSENSFIGCVTRYRQRKTANDGERIREVMVDYLTNVLGLGKKAQDRSLKDLPLISQAQSLRKERDPRSEALNDDPTTRVFYRQIVSDKTVPEPQLPIHLHGLTGLMPVRLWICAPRRLQLAQSDTLRTFKQQAPVPIPNQFLG